MKRIRLALATEQISARVEWLDCRRGEIGGIAQCIKISIGNGYYVASLPAAHAVSVNGDEFARMCSSLSPKMWPAIPIETDARR